MDCHVLVLPTLETSVHVAPESPEVHMEPGWLLPPNVGSLPFNVAAASFVPSAEDVMAYQLCSPVSDHQFSVPSRTAVQDAPESCEVQMRPLYSTAASFVPSVEDVIDLQLSPAMLESSVHVSPESPEVQMNSGSDPATASLVPSAEDVIALKDLMFPMLETSVHAYVAAPLTRPWSEGIDESMALWVVVVAGRSETIVMSCESISSDGMKA